MTGGKIQCADVKLLFLFSNFYIIVIMIQVELVIQYLLYKLVSEVGIKTLIIFLCLRRRKTAGSCRAALSRLRMRRLRSYCSSACSRAACLRVLTHCTAPSLCTFFIAYRQPTSPHFSATIGWGSFNCMSRHSIPLSLFLLLVLIVHSSTQIFFHYLNE